MVILRVLIVIVLASFIVSNGLAGYSLISKSTIDLVNSPDATDENEKEKEQSKFEKDPEIKVDLRSHLWKLAYSWSLDQKSSDQDFHSSHIRETPTPPPKGLH